MLKWLIVGLIVLGTGIWFGVRTEFDPGYLLLAYQEWTIEMPLWLATVVILLALLVLEFLAWLLRSLFASKRRLSLWHQHRLHRRAHRYTTQGMLALAEGRWGKAEQQLIKGAEHSETPLLNYLMAAQVAQEQGNPELRDQYLHSAHNATDNAALAVGLTQAQLQFRHGQLEEALATLRHLQTLSPQHRYVLKLLQKIYVRLQDWSSLKELLPVLRKQRVLSPEALVKLEKQIVFAMLEETAKAGNSDDLINLWEKSSSAVQEDPVLLKHYAQLLNEQGAGLAAEHALRFALKRLWNEELVTMYGVVEGADAGHQLKHAESWLKAHANNPALQLCIARLALRNQLWGKARTHLETTIELEPSRTSYAMLGQLLEELGETTEAHEAYRRGCLLSQ